jgi:hypothetical protein
MLQGAIIGAVVGIIAVLVKAVFKKGGNPPAA